ncbi:MAG: M14 family zinc carboxypeptidase [Pyrinomonadaceae bacterium]
MRLAIFLSLFVITVSVAMIDAQTPAEFGDIWEREHVSSILPSNVRHTDLKEYLDGLNGSGITVNEVGRSVAGKEIYQVEFGKGPLKVFLWSQMHGDEPTATSALVDLFAILRRNHDKDWVKRIANAITVRAVPMLNPDGTEQYIRRNLQGLDINRDALNLKSPEARLLKRLRDEWSPNIGFNLHNQNALTTVGATNKQAAISLLVVYGDEKKTTSEGHERNKRLVSEMIKAIEPFIPGHIGRYDDEFTATAFGDNFSAWGTPVILIETGALYGKSEMFLVKMNFIAIATALRSLADGSEKSVSPVAYELLPNNSSGRLMDFIFRSATLPVVKVGPDNRKSVEFLIASIGANTSRRREEFAAPTVIRSIGDLSAIAGLEEYDASGFYAVGRFQPLAAGHFGEILFYRKDRQIDWTVADLEKSFPPDAIFSLGKWLKGENVVPKK